MKKYILSLFVGLVGFISFCNAGLYSFTGVVSNNTHYFTIPDGLTNGCDFYMSCFYDNTVNDYLTLLITYNGGSSFSLGNNTLKKDYGNFGYDFNKRNGCNTVNSLGFYLYNANNFNYTCTLYGNSITTSNCPECPTCPEVNTGEILSGYILESEIDTNYCVGNGLCPNECGSGSDLSGDLQYSNLYINNILHPGRQNIFVDIPDYITWDYSSTGDDFNLYVGSGYDMDYMNSIIKINSYRPDSQDFTSIFVSGLTLVFPYIAILLLIVFMWKLLKRIFK